MRDAQAIAEAMSVRPATELALGSSGLGAMGSAGFARAFHDGELCLAGVLGAVAIVTRPWAARRMRLAITMRRSACE